MSQRSRLRHKSRRERGGFTAIPHAVQDSHNWRQCSHAALHLLLDLARQFNGRNNGDLCAALSILRKHGWTSNDTVSVALKELRHYGLIVLTRQGGLHAPSLYALTWHPIDDCRGKLDVGATTLAPGDWKQQRPAFERPRKKTATPPDGSDSHRHAEQTTC